MRLLPRNPILKVVTVGVLSITLVLGTIIVLALAHSPDLAEYWDPPFAPRSLSTAPGAFELQVTPPSALVDEPVEITVRGLKPGEEVILRGTTDDAGGRTFSSWARFLAGDDGTVDLSKTAPLEGTYRSIDGSGLLWSMRSDPDEFFRTSFSWTVRDYRISAETRQGVVEAVIEREYAWGEIPPQQVDVFGVAGELWLPESEGLLPAIVRLPGAGGAPSRTRSSLLAARGFAVLDLLYLSNQPSAQEFVEVPVDSAVSAVDWLVAHPNVDGSRVGIYGGSRGADLALLTAAYDPRIGAVAGWAPASVVFQGISLRDLSPGSSWTWQGAPLPYASPELNYTTLRNAVRMLLQRPTPMRPAYESALEQAPAGAFIPVERIAGPVLLLAGSDDKMVPGTLMAAQLHDRLTEYGFRHQLRNIVYDGAGHAMNFGLWPGTEHRLRRRWSCDELWSVAGWGGTGYILPSGRHPGGEPPERSRCVAGDPHVLHGRVEIAVLGRRCSVTSAIDSGHPSARSASRKLGWPTPPSCHGRPVVTTLRRLHEGKTLDADETQHVRPMPCGAGTGASRVRRLGQLGQGLLPTHRDRAEAPEDAPEILPRAGRLAHSWFGGPSQSHRWQTRRGIPSRGG